MQDLSPALRACSGGSSRAIAFDTRQSEACVYGDVADALDCQRPIQGACLNFGVRRLMPIECERLQGMPDGWTDIIHRGKPAFDGPRYKAIGNSWAVPVVAWIGVRMKTELDEFYSRMAA
jgi:DNA (cytosine-5)-methyltransferase 1